MFTSPTASRYEPADRLWGSWCQRPAGPLLASRKKRET
jgi:hypothetical protein